MDMDFHWRRRRGRGAVAGLLLALTAAIAVSPVRADMGAEPEATDAPAGRSIEAPSPDAREAAKSKKRLETLQRQHEELEFKKRTKAPFTSERSLRHQLRRNEAQQGWEKSEQRRLEYEQLRQGR